MFARLLEVFFGASDNGRSRAEWHGPAGDHLRFLMRGTEVHLRIHMNPETLCGIDIDALPSYCSGPVDALCAPRITCQTCSTNSMMEGVFP